MSNVNICVFIIIVFISVSINALPVKNNSEFELRIIHTNDMHARFEETSAVSSICSVKLSKEGKCYGGFARLATLIRQARNSNSNTLFLNGGDTYQGSIWFTVHKWKIASKFLNLLAPDAVSLGNHEFDNGVSGLVPFINNAMFPIVTANLDLSEEPTLKASKLLNSTVLEVNGKKIGVIGYLTPDTKNIAMTDNVIFLDEVETIREEAKKLKSQGINILIALGHSGFDMDKKIAREVEDIDLVIGGHTNTFLYVGEEPDSEISEGFYPTEITQKNGRKTYVVQAYAYTKYLGNLNIKFDKEDEISFIHGNPILVDGKIQQAKDILDELDKWRTDIDKLKNEVIGSTKVFLQGDSKICRRMECDLGNMITDAMIKYNAEEYSKKNGWTDAAIAIVNSGSIRNSITEDNDNKITRADVKAVLPFGNTLRKMKMTGSLIIKLLEFSVKDLVPDDTSNLYGSFLQVSGIQVVYDLSKAPGSRVLSVEVRCAFCKVPSFSKIDKKAVYNVLINDFLVGGGDNYMMLKGLKNFQLGVELEDVLIQYFEKKNPINSGTEDRIRFISLEKYYYIRSSASSLNFLAILITLPLIRLTIF